MLRQVAGMCSFTMGDEGVQSAICCASSSFWWRQYVNGPRGASACLERGDLLFPSKAGYSGGPCQKYTGATRVLVLLSSQEGWKVASHPGLACFNQAPQGLQVQNGQTSPAIAVSASQRLVQVHGSEGMRIFM